MHDDQFTAQGPPNPGSGPGFPSAGFSTMPEAGFQFGVRVNANRCGVMGQTAGGGVAGVYGHGRFSQFGVLGTGFGSRIGVVGASIDNTNNLMNLNVPPGDFNLDSLGEGSGTGVLGKSGSGFGVHGISDSSTAVLGTSTAGIGSHGSSDTSTGVYGSSRSGYGVHGTSERGPGGVFASQADAQLHLEPREIVASPEGVVAGAGGDLLATRAPGLPGPEFRLWFCTRAGDAASAQWELIAGSRPYPQHQPSEGSSGIDVKRIQMRLNMITGTQLNGDGEFGPVTRDAVAAFQEREGLGPTGAVDVTTWYRLFALS